MFVLRPRRPLRNLSRAPEMPRKRTRAGASKRQVGPAPRVAGWGEREQSLEGAMLALGRQVRPRRPLQDLSRAPEMPHKRTEPWERQVRSAPRVVECVGREQ